MISNMKPMDYQRYHVSDTKLLPIYRVTKRRVSWV